MNTFKLIISYDGTDYAGWQVQPTGDAVANILQFTFQEVFKTNVNLLGASRTDAGVHGLGQVARCSIDFSISAATLQRAWNNKLPSSIVIRSCIQVDQSFHPHINVVQKTYWYHFFTERPLPFIARYGVYIQRRVDFDMLQKALDVFVGTHDFRSFCTGDEQDSTIRTIDSIKLHYIKRYGMYRIEVKGERFLRYMIRRIVGAALLVASREHLSIQDIITTLEAKNPAHALPTAPPQGLVLRKILYKN